MKKIIILSISFCFLSNLFAQQCSGAYTMDQIVVFNKVDDTRIPSHNRKYSHINPIPPRFQWNINDGYCGEVSMISAGLYYGQYLPQYDVREYAAPGQRQKQQLLLGVNDGAAASALNFKYERVESNNNAEFLTWVKHHVALGHPVIIGVLNNENMLYGSTNTHKGDTLYDHIVPVIGFYSDKPLSYEYDSTDVILFSDNGLYTPNDAASVICYPPHTKVSNQNVPYYYSSRLSEFCLDRVNANNPNGPAYSLLLLPRNTSTNYGIAITGILGNERLKPVRITTDYNFEIPCSAVNPPTDPSKTIPIELSIEICDLIHGKKYDIYHYTNMDQVPIGDAKQEKAHFWKRIEATSTTHVEKMKIDSWKQAIFRVVEVVE